jgi:hypothetical protein
LMSLFALPTRFCRLLVPFNWLCIDPSR